MSQALARYHMDSRSCVDAYVYAAQKEVQYTISVHAASVDLMSLRAIARQLM